MPTYDFRCPQGHEFTHFYKTISGSKTQLPCPQCSAVADRQLSGGGGLVFKGSGFYLTDYGKNAHRAPDVGRQTSDAGTKGEGGPAADSASKSDGPKSDGPKSDGSKSDGSKSDASKSDSSKSDRSGSRSERALGSESKSGSSSAKAPSAEGPKPKSDVRKPSSE